MCARGFLLGSGCNTTARLVPALGQTLWHGGAFVVGWRADSSTRTCVALLQFQSLYGKKAAALYTQAGDYQKTARFYYKKAEDTYYQVLAGQSWAAWKGTSRRRAATGGRGSRGEMRRGAGRGVKGDALGVFFLHPHAAAQSRLCA